MLSIGEKVTVRLLALEPADKGDLPRLRLSLKALDANAESKALAPGEVLAGKVSSVSGFGVFVETEKGTGLVPQRELGLPRGADHRKLLPVDTEVRVVLVNKDAGGKITFSMSRVAGVEERQNYREFTKKKTPQADASQVGALGLLLKSKLGLNPESVAAAARPTQRQTAVQKPQLQQAVGVASQPNSSLTQPAAAPPAQSLAPSNLSPAQAAKSPAKRKNVGVEMPVGVTRRRR